MSIRVNCKVCHTQFRSESSSEWDTQPLFETDPKTGQRIVVNPGRHHPKHNTCRGCYLKQGTRRPIPGRTKKARPVRTVASKLALVTSTPGKGKGKGK